MDVQSHRKARLRELIDHTCNGVIATFANSIGKDESYTARMLYPSEKNGSKPIGDKMQLIIEAKYNLPRAWFDMSMGECLPNSEEKIKQVGFLKKEETPPELSRPSFGWPFEKVSREDYSILSKMHKEQIENMILVIIETIKQTGTGNKISEAA